MTDAHGRPGRVRPGPRHAPWAGALALCLAAVAAPARAELWGFVDGAGVVHVAAAPTDARYRPLLSTPRGDPARVSGKVDGLGGLLTWLEIAPQARTLRPWLREAERRYGVDRTLLKALIAVESGFDPNAVSRAGAIGLMQIMPISGDRYATPQERATPAAERLRDPRTNILTGARMLADLQRRFEGIDVALAAWNAGEGTVRRHGGVLPPIAETRAHVQMVLELYWQLLQHDLARRATALRVQPG